MTLGHPHTLYGIVTSGSAPHPAHPSGASTYRVSDDPESGHYAVLMRDPEGNEFCVA